MQLDLFTATTTNIHQKASSIKGLATSLMWTDPFPCRAFIACSISARSPEALVEVTDLTSSKATSFWWMIICFNCVKVTKGIQNTLKTCKGQCSPAFLNEQIPLVTLTQLKQIIAHQKLVAFDYDYD